MKIHYLDSSAFLKMFLPEPETESFVNWIREIATRTTLVSSEILRVETLRALALNHPERVSDAEKVLKTLNVVRVSRANLQLAARLKPTKLRTLDAIHLSTALDLAEEDLYFVSYDKLLLEAAKINGLQTLTPS